MKKWVWGYTFRMTLGSWLTLLSWLAFIVVWSALAVFAKRNTRATAWWRRGAFRLAVLALLIVLYGSGALKLNRAQLALLAHTSNASVALLGGACAVLGIAFAVWARLYLGRNWGMPQSVKENPELVTTGPYAYIRHPIYSGMLLALFGSALANNPLWFIVFIAAGLYFAVSAQKEETLLLNTFPDTYPAYRARTKRFIPFMY